MVFYSHAMLGEPFILAMSKRVTVVLKAHFLPVNKIAIALTRLLLCKGCGTRLVFAAQTLQRGLVITRIFWQGYGYHCAVVAGNCYGAVVRIYNFFANRKAYARTALCAFYAAFKYMR